MSDADLRDLFARLKREDAAATRPFGATVRAARAGPRRPPLVRTALVLAAAVVLLLVIKLGPPERRRPEPGFALQIDLATARWVAPTDFLLRTPGLDLLRSVPQLGSQGYVPAATGWGALPDRN